MYAIPSINDDLKLFAKRIGCVWMGVVEIKKKPLCKECDCHNNVLTYISTYGGHHKLGYYFVKNLTTGKFEAILHSTLLMNNAIIDITPFCDERTYNIIGLLDTVNLSKFKQHVIQ